MKIDSIITMKFIRVLPLILIGLLLLTGAAAAADTSTFAIHVLDENGNSVDNANLVISNGSLTEPIKGVTDASGFFKVFLVTGSEYSISINKDGYNIYQGSLINDGISVNDIRLKSTTKEVRFYIFDNSQNPLEGITVSAIDSKGEVIGKTDKTGCAILGLIQENPYKITAGSEYYSTYNDTISIAKTNEHPTYTYILTRATIAPVVTVYNEKKNVIKNANVYLNGNFVSTTDEYGKCQLPTIETGKYPLSVQASGYSLYSEEQNITKNTNGITVEMNSASVTITITVKDTNGNVLEKASVFSNGDLVGVTDNKGVLTFSSDVGKSIKLTASHDGYTTSVERTYTVVNGENAPEIRLELGTSFVNITITDTEGAPLPLATINVDGNAVGQTDALGNFKYTTITGKTHQISASLDGYSGEGTTITVQPGENTLILPLSKSMNILWIIIAGAAGVVIILIIILVLTGRKRGGFDGKKRNGGGRYAAPPNRRDSL